MDPADLAIRYMDSLPPEERLPDWDHTRALMVRPAPEAGAPAPDFTLKTLDGTTKITLSKVGLNQPVVLIFGSYT
jgi:hypothetical protein